jgi:hypothetical protein
MHQYVTGNWAASNYTSRGDRTDHRLFLSPDGSWVWTRRDAGGKERRSTGTWTHDAAQDVLQFSHKSGPDEGCTESWSIHFVSACEDANTILVLRFIALASRNLPVVFQRIHPPDDPILNSR